MESEYVKHRERGSCWHIFGLCEKLSDMLNIVQYCLNINLEENRALIMEENEAYSAIGHHATIRATASQQTLLFAPPWAFE